MTSIIIGIDMMICKFVKEFLVITP